jgi:hypothetical protein
VKMLTWYLNEQDECVAFASDENGAMFEIVRFPSDALNSLLLELATVQDAANAVGLTPDDLIAEAQAWEAAEPNA